MGTSVSQRSPSTPNWRVVEKGYIRDDIPIERITQELWRAAINQPEGNLLRDLSEPIIAQCIQIVERANTRNEALNNIRHEISKSGQVSLATEIAQRAAVQAFLSTEDRTNAFVHSLFSEAGNYLVSRDISGFIGLGRLSSVSDAIAFKKDVKQRISVMVKEVRPPSRDFTNPGVWKEYSGRIVNHLVGGINV